eukprot:TRINITY_DN5190_c0_g1_i1.p1 TRINITY_DN5190_c0_g1~~TRINITY_DN5190_c0_g1_i1.p1  ORF type:complete len:456 (-),score=133.35 TRINITY_DN5190_c0_g1_i1:52-1281(-)
MNRASKKLDNSPVSVFSFDTRLNPSKQPLASNYFKKLRTLRHPNILTFVDGMEIEGANVTIVTEEVEPLQEVLGQFEEYPNGIVWGLYQIANALSFINNEGKMIHGNLRMENIFVTKSGDWKLGGFDLTSLSNDSTAILRNGGHNSVMPALNKSPEYQKNDFSHVDGSVNFSIDSWSLAVLIYELYNGKLKQMEDLKKIGKIPKELLPQYQQMLSSNPSKRPNPQNVLKESQYFQNPFVQTCLFLEQIALKDQAEKEAFIRKLEGQLSSFPESFAKYKVLPLLTNLLDYGSPNSKVLLAVFQIAKRLSKEEFEKTLVSSLVKWYACPDRAFRSCLLQNMEFYIDLVPNSVIDAQIFPHIATGFTDTSPALRELTIKSSLIFVPKLTEALPSIPLSFSLATILPPEPEDL